MGSCSLLGCALHIFANNLEPSDQRREQPASLFNTTSTRVSAESSVCLHDACVTGVSGASTDAVTFRKVSVVSEISFGHSGMVHSFKKHNLADSEWVCEQFITVHQQVFASVNMKLASWPDSCFEFCLMKNNEPWHAIISKAASLSLESKIYLLTTKTHQVSLKQVFPTIFTFLRFKVSQKNQQNLSFLLHMYIFVVLPVAGC